MPYIKIIPAYFRSTLTWKAIAGIFFFQISSLFARKEEKTVFYFSSQAANVLPCQGTKIRRHCRQYASSRDAKLHPAQLKSLKSPLPALVGVMKSMRRPVIFVCKRRVLLSRHLGLWDAARRGLLTTQNAARIISGSSAP